MNRILVIGCLPGINGISSCICNLYKHLDRTQFEWEFLVSQDDFDSGYGFDALKELNAKIHVIDYKRTHYPRVARQHLKELMMSIPNLCGVHLHDTGSLNVYPIYLADQMNLPIQFIQMHSSGDVQPRSDTLSNRALAARRRIISGNKVVRLACSTPAGIYGYGNLLFSLFPNATDFDHFSYNPIYRELVRSRLNIPADAAVVGFPGHFWDVKNPLFAVEVFKAFHALQPDSHFILLGDGPLRKDSHRICKDAGILSYTHFLGYRPEMELFLNAMDVILCTSYSEGLPNTLIEAQATGLPCLVSENVSREASVTELVEQLSLESPPYIWANKIAKMLQSRTSRRSYHVELKEAGYDIVDSANSLISRFNKCLSV